MSDGPALLDVNLLIALFYPDHIHHEVAHDWFADNRSRGWATCPLTENGLVRILSGTAYGGPVNRAADVAARLHAFCRSGDHRFWTDAISLLDEKLFARAFLTHRRTTDIYLLGLAEVNGGVLATFDRSIPVKAVVGAQPDLLEVIAPAVEG